MTDLLSQARQLAQASIAVFPVNSDKRPAIKGWRAAATTQDETLVGWFDPKYGRFRKGGIGVPCGPDQDLICFDLDFGHTEDAARKAALSAWVAAHVTDNDMVRRTRSGGLHVICGWPDVQRVPRRLMPKLDVIIEGFYFCWDTAAGDYRHESGPSSIEHIQVATPEMCVVVEADTLGTGSALMSYDEAHEAMWSNGDAGMRHDALLRMTKDWAEEHPNDDIGDWCAGFYDWFLTIYGDRIEEDRLIKLLEWHVEDERGELYRAFKGVRLATIPDDLLAAAGAKLAALGAQLPGAKQTVIERPSTPQFTAIEGQLFRPYAQGVQQEEPAAWLIPNLLRERGNAGFTGMSGVGKTTITASWIAGVISGRPDVVGLPDTDRPIGVAWLNAEEEAADMLQHVDIAMRTHGLKAAAPLIVVGEEQIDSHEDGLSLVVKKFNPELRTSELVVNDALVDKIVEEIKAAGVEIMIADPITEFNDGDENSRGDAKKLSRAFRLIAQRSGVAVIYWAHTGKPAPSARPDWYRADLYAQRGSSQNVGALKTAGTVWHMCPQGLTAGQAWDWVKKAKSGDHPDTPNIVALTVVKIKKSPVFFEVAYELRPSSIDRDVPVVLPMTMDAAALTLDAASSSSAELFQSNITLEMINRLGEGAHKRNDVLKMMEGARGWPKDVRADRVSGRDLLRHWARGVEASTGGWTYLVTTEFKDEAPGAAPFTVSIRKLS